MTIMGTRSTTANMAWTTKESFVQKSCPNEYKKFMDTLEKEEISLDDVSCQALGNEIDNEAVFDAYTSLQRAFLAKVGLELSLGYHNSEEDGSEYDDVNGTYWELAGVEEMTPNAKELYEKNLISKSMWVRY